MFMKPICKIVIITAAIFLWSCMPKVGYEKYDPAAQLFSEAEKMFQEKSYEKALVLFNEYLDRFPDRSMAGAALMKTGAIHMALGNNESARNVYKRLIAEYPESYFVPDARIEIMVTYYNQREYETVIEQAADFLKHAVSRPHILRTYVLAGDTYLALGSLKDAIDYYALAYSKAQDPGKKIIITKIKDAVRLFSPQDIQLLLSRLEKRFPAGYLMFQLGVNSAGEDKYDEALTVLSEFIEKFPAHENVQQAKNLIAEINQKSIYSRYTIGCLLPLSGPYRLYGNRALNAVELALNRFSQQNSNPSIKVIIKDTESDPIKAVLAVRELFDENVAAIIGPVFMAEPAALEAQDKGMPIITLTQKDNITSIGDWVFRNFFTPITQVKTLVSYAVEELKVNRFAILYPHENYGLTFMNLFWDEVIALGGRVTGVESYNSAHTDFSDSIKKLVGLYYKVPENLKITDNDVGDEKNDDAAAGNDEDTSLAYAYEYDENIPEEKEKQPQAIVDFDAVFIPDAPKKAGLIIPQLAFYDITDTYLLGTNLWHSGRLIEMARQYVQDAIMPDGFFAQSDSQEVMDFVKAFHEIFDRKPEFIEAVAYDTAMILFQMISRPDIRFRSALKNNLKKLTDFQGVTGLTSFDDNGEVRRKLYLLQIKGDRFVELKHN
jgi:ABC-type branched-subunit amino acid transport system substrate-binding protein/predicted negative regulator of RcsB-dependent stress response